jgi:monoterpene epsilon-lactone hydrolase
MSLRAELLRLGLRAFLKPRAGALDLELWRRRMRATERLVPRPPGRCQTTEMRSGGLIFQRVIMPASRPERAVLYLHGGGYVSGGPCHYRHFTWRIADALSATVWVLAYRLAPEHPFPAALEDAAEACACLAGNASERRRLFVMGDSAGGGLTLALLLKLRDEEKSLPRAAIALSPWTDLALTGPSLKANASADPMLNPSHLPDIARLYLAGCDPRAPYASPLYGDAAHLPPVLIQVGSDESLRDDAVRMAEKLARYNSRSRLEVWPRMPHCWQLCVPVLPEARRAIKQIASFVAEVEAV